MSREDEEGGVRHLSAWGGEIDAELPGGGLSRPHPHPTCALLSSANDFHGLIYPDSQRHKLKDIHLRPAWVHVMQGYVLTYVGPCIGPHHFDCGPGKSNLFKAEKTVLIVVLILYICQRVFKYFEDNCGKRAREKSSPISNTLCKLRLFSQNKILLLQREGKGRKLSR